MTNTSRIKSNIRSMIDQGATEAEIDTYIASENGPDGQAFKAALPATASPSQPSAEESNAVLQALFDRGASDAEIEQFLKSNGYQVPQGVKVYAAWRRENPDYAGDFRAVDIPLANDGPLEFQNTKGGLEGTVSSVLDGVLPGLSRNAAGLGAGIANTLGTRFKGQDLSFGEAYDLGSGFSEAGQAEFEDENPLLSGAAKTTGFVGSLALPVTKLGQAGSAGAHSIGNAALNSAVTGGLYGTAAGALNDTGEGRLENAGLGGLTGTVFGGAVPPALGSFRALGSMVRRNVPGVDGVASSVGNSARWLAGLPKAPPATQQQANRMIGESVAASPKFNTPAAVADEVSRRVDLGVPAIPADLSNEPRDLLRTALSGSGPMASRARQVPANRQAQQAARVRQHIEYDLGPSVDPVQAVYDVRRRAASAAAPAYKQAYNEGLTVSQEMQDIMRAPIFQTKLNEQAQELAAFGKNPMDFGFIAQPGGNYTFGKTPSLEAVDMVIRKINKDIPRDAFGKPVLDSFNYSLHDLGKRMDVATREANPLFDVAKSNYADEMAIQQALEQGQKVGRYSGHEINAQTATMPQHAQEAWLSGASTALSDRAGKTGLKPAANVAADTQRQLGFPGAGLSVSHGDAVKLGSLDNLTGRPGSMGRLGERLELEDDAYQTFASANRSRSGKPDFGSVAGGADILSSAVGLAAGDVTGTLLSAFLRGNPKGTGKFRQEVQEQIADTLTKTNPLEVQQAMQAIERQTAADAAKRARMGAAGTQIGRAGAVQFGGLDGDPYVPR